MKKKILLILMFLMSFTGLVSADVQDETVCNNAVGTHDGYFYNLWNESGGDEKACMTLKAGGTFSCEWSDIGNVFFQSGSQFDAYQTYQQLGNVKIDYAANFEPGGNSFLCVYGWTTDPVFEYYIVESWGTWRPTGGNGYKGAVFTDGDIYDIYKTRRYVINGIDGPGYYDQFWSVRSSKRTSGTVSVVKHFKAWDTLGMQPGAISELTFCVEGYQSIGYADVYEMSIYTTGEDDDDYTVITTPFIKEGAGNFKWVLSEIPAYINSWCLDSLTINGVDFTNTWVSASDLPAKQNGYFYIDYEASYPWSHVELE